MAKRGFDEVMAQSFRERRDTKRELENLNQNDEVILLLRGISEQLAWMSQWMMRAEQRQTDQP